MELAFTLAFCVLTSFFFTWAARKLKVSAVVGLIAAGLVIGSSFLKPLMLEPNTDAVLFLGNLGLIFLMFLTGMEISWSNFRKEGKDAAAVSFFAAVTPFCMGAAVSYFAFGFSPLTSLTIGVCMSITAEAANARVMLEMRKLRTRVGSLMMGAGIIDDVFGISVFLVVSYLFVHTFATSELMMLLLSIGAFFAGILANSCMGRESREAVLLERALLLFLVPFLFIAMGIEFNPQSLTLNPALVLAVVSIAIIGKICGSMLAKTVTDMSFRQLYLVGWGMNARGAIELAIAFIAFRLGLLETSVYSSLVIMALATTLIFPFFLRSAIKRDPGVME
jgi:Kef-type K+ transport system membrane component KefB